MKHQVFSEELVASVVKELHVADLANATIGDVLLVASRLEELTGIPFIRMDEGGARPWCRVTVSCGSRCA